MMVHPGRLAFLRITGHGMGRHGDHWQVLNVRVLADFARGRVPVHYGHADGTRQVLLPALGASGFEIWHVTAVRP